MQRLKKILRYAGTFLAGMAAAMLAALAYIFGRKNKSDGNISGVKIEDEAIERKAEDAREDARSRISSANARDLCDGYGAALDAIADGKERFRRKASTVARHGGADSGGMAKND